MLVTQSPHVTWLDAVRYWWWRLTRSRRRKTSTLSPSPAPTGSGRRFPIAPERAAYFYRAADDA